MRKYNLNIAGYIIGFESAADGPELKPSAKFLRNISGNIEPDILIRIHSFSFELPERAERVFNAPYVEEINGVHFTVDTHFWSIWKDNSDLYIKTMLPLSEAGRSATLQFSLTSYHWDLWIDGAEKETDPLEYPLDGLILYYLTVIKSDIMIHASGVNYKGKGYLFSGISGKGKSTMAKLWEKAGAHVVHDDRLIIRKNARGYKMYNTPVYMNDEPRESDLNNIYIIGHGSENILTSLNGVDAVSGIMANCIQHNWGTEIIAGLLGTISVMSKTISISKLHFLPDSRVTDYILKNE